MRGMFERATTAARTYAALKPTPLPTIAALAGYHQSNSKAYLLETIYWKLRFRGYWKPSFQMFLGTPVGALSRSGEDPPPPSHHFANMAMRIPMLLRLFKQGRSRHTSLGTHEFAVQRGTPMYRVQVGLLDQIIFDLNNPRLKCDKCSKTFIGKSTRKANSSVTNARRPSRELAGRKCIRKPTGPKLDHNVAINAKRPFLTLGS
ncbi:hypothetical protein F4819DRAFT_286577 [Hypoxylon fuscum]|nr:hypothetical protein F4819DRAFT_286577 [Hypoxylon fuscum]